MSLDDERQRGLLAETLRNNPLLKEIFQSLESSYIADWSQTDLSDTEKREQSFYMLRALQDIKNEIDSIVTSGKIADQQIRTLFRKK
jgi:hypothetical protein|tara:strand:- start:1092 stop:1352 length:261 start_codon:yes stop_codon:yes gene_type:complete